MADFADIQVALIQAAAQVATARIHNKASDQVAVQTAMALIDALAERLGVTVEED